jgi:CubicO group peptidase (beta-lactamase class C family)
MKCLFFSLLSLLTVLGHSFSATEYKTFLDEQAKEFIKKNNAAGLAIAIYKEAFDLEKPYEKIFCFGQARRSRKINVSESTIFRLGPLAKLFTVFLLLKFEDQGKCQLEECVDKYFPKTFTFPAYHKTKPTLKQLALELSGLPNQPSLPVNLSQVSENEIRSFFTSYKLLRAPGKKYEPSELGYSCLSYLLSRSGKTSYKDAIIKEILQPLGMTETHATVAFSKTHKLAIGHKGIAEVAEHLYQKDGSFFKSILGWNSTIEDMQKLLRFLIAKNSQGLEVIKKNLYKIEYVFLENPTQKLSLGLKVAPLSPERQVALYHQHISYHGYDHFIGVIPEMRVGVVILSNTEYSVADIAKKLLEETFK